MTKLKSKKMSKSTFAVIIMAIVMVAMLAFGGTYAYFTASSFKAQGEVNMGRVSLKANSSAQVTNGDLVPTETVLQGTIGYTNDSTTATFIAVKFDVKYSGNVWIAAEDDAEDVEEQTTSKATAIKTDYAPYFEGYTDENSVPTLTVVYKYDANGNKLFNDKDTDDVKDEGENYLVAGYILAVEDMPLEASQFVNAFITKKDGNSLSSLITTTNWQQGKVNTNIYMMKNANSYSISAEVKDEVDFIDATGDNVIVFDVDRHFTNGMWFGSADGELQWEDADVTISFAAYSIQVEGLTYDADNDPDTANVALPTDVVTTGSAEEQAAANGAIVDTIWEVMNPEMPANA